MPKDKLVAEVLDRCLQRVQQVDSTLDECLGKYPDLADELRPLLLAAAQAREQLAPAGPARPFGSSSRARVLDLTRSRLKQRRHAPPRRRLIWRPAHALSTLLLILALLGSGVGVAYASNDALPGDSLYGVKRGMEQAALAISHSMAGDTRLLLRHAERRVAELQQLVEDGRLSDLEPAVSGYRSSVEQVLSLIGSDPDRLASVDEALVQQEAVLSAAMAAAPEQAVPAIEGALDYAQHGRQVVEQVRSGGHPSDLAPGQLKKLGEQGEDCVKLPPGQVKKQERDGDREVAGHVKKDACPSDQDGD